MSKTRRKIKVIIADDHVLMRNALSRLVGTLEGYEVLAEADNGRDLKNKILQHLVPDIVLLDVNMPEMYGHQAWKKQQTYHQWFRCYKALIFPQGHSG